MNDKFVKAIRERRLIFDGAMGSVLQTRGLAVGTPPETWSLSAPDAIEALHREYLAAGADIITANTFGVNPLKYPNYKEYIEAAVAIAKRAAADYPGALVALDVGPLGRLIAPLGQLDFEEAVAAFRSVVSVGAAMGCDLVLIETMNDSYETKAAVLGAKEAADLPIAVTNVYDSKHKLMTGASPAAMIAMLEGLGVSAVGMNCSLGPDKMAEILPEFISRSSLPVIVMPNAGLPRIENGHTVYDIGADDFAAEMAKMAKLGAAAIGGCCGTTPEFIAKIKRATADIPYSCPTKKAITAISSYTHAVEFGPSPILIGERINPTGKPKLKAAIREGNISYILKEALSEAERGAHVLDVNVGLPEISEPDVMRSTVYAIQTVTDTPLEIDSSDPMALEAAMRIYNGKPLVNSVNGKAESMRAIFPLVKKYGGVLIALTIDESGIPESAEGRVAIAEKIINEARAYGISENDIIVDPLALSVSADKNAALVTLESIRLLSERGIKTSLGVSNVSFGLPARDTVNAAFFTSALTLGLSAAIMNPYSDAMMNAYRAYRALVGLDVACAEYISANSSTEEKKETATVVTLGYAIRHGMSREAREAARRELESTPALEVVNAIMIPALNDVGAAFESGRAYLPELLMSAEAASEAFAEVKAKIPPKESGTEKILLATVKGDIHDIGKNIVKVMLESYGFAVVDLGKDVSPEAVLAAAREHKARLVGLSALMTTTLPSMKETVLLLARELPEVRVMVGGAVLTEEYAKAIGAHFYAADAMESVRIAEAFYGKRD